MKYNLEQVLEVLSKINDPESGKDIVSLKMVQALSIEREKISFSLVSPSKSPFVNSIKKACIKSLNASISENLIIEIDTSGAKRVISAGRTDKEEVLPGVKNIIAIASGKGGVGKSTVSVNLAVALANTGAKVGLLDADVYGPSQPKMMGLEDAKPEIKKVNGKDIIYPVEKFGVKMLSIGFFVKPEQALIWRGAMATSALNQFIKDTDWGDLDYLLIDLPPGTGDIHLTLVQAVPVTGAVIVSTPQQVAIADAIKGISMFKANKIEVPILGLIENMAWFTPAELPENKYYIFGKDGMKILAEESGIPLLGQIPIVQSICEAGDSGVPPASGDGVISDAFKNLAENLANNIEQRNIKLTPTKKVEIDPNATHPS